VSDRFRVTSACGFTINPRSGPATGGAGARQPKRSFAVLDSAFCYRIVAEFNTGSNSAGGERSNEIKAHALCDELNLWDDEHGTKTT